MFLAINEIRHDRKRYGLIIGVVALIAYLVSFLTALAYGLAWSNRTAVDDWHASGIVLSGAANKSLAVSTFAADDYLTIDAPEKAPLFAVQSVVYPNLDVSEGNQVNVAFFGVDQDSFLFPTISEGTYNPDPGNGKIGVIVSSSLKKKAGVTLGEEFYAARNDDVFVVTGFTPSLEFNTSPVVFTEIATARMIRTNMMVGNVVGPELISAVVVRGVDNSVGLPDLTDNLVYYDINTFIKAIPGYQPQVITFSLMIVFLVLIAALIIGIFMYILTLQKTNIFGVLKAQGISSFYIGKSVFWETVLLSLFGLAIGLGLTLLSGVFLPPTVPFLNNWLLYGAVIILMLIFATIGSLFSVRTIVKVDPLKAIG